MRTKILPPPLLEVESTHIPLLMPSTSSTLNYAKHRSHGNRHRRGFSLSRQRHMIPVLLVAAVAAAIVHLLALRASPWILNFWNSQMQNSVKEANDAQLEAARIVVRRTEAELETEMPPLEQQQEMETLEPDPQEIDLIDAQVKELVMAPGETNLSLPAPEEIPENSAAELAPTPPSMNLPEAKDMPPLSPLLPEPTPINTNSVIANAAPQNELLEDAEGFIDQELRRQASEGSSNLPSDTRSLSELMGLSNLGSSSGVARLGADILFEFDESRLKNSARVSMLQLAALIHKNPTTIFIIEGHTDAIGTEEYNRQLSLRRAQAVISWLEQNAVPIRHVYLRACGSSHPLVNTSLPREQQSLNRRVEIHMRQPREALPEGSQPARYTPR